MAKLIFRHPDEPSIKPQATKMAARRKLKQKALVAAWILQTVATLVYVYLNLRA